jgi:nicotinamide-nucleotide amidase
MKAEIITIGDEILIGQIIDTNSAWIAEQFNLAGIEIYRIISVHDDAGQIAEAMAGAAEKAELVILTGGLGPTKDDITKHALCDFFNTRLVFHGPTFEHIKQLFKNRNIDLNKLNRDQALVPENCTVLPNTTGTAPGLWLEKENTIYVAVPGVPFEMKHLIEYEILPRIKINRKTDSIYHRTLLTQGLPESILATHIEQWETALPENIRLAYLPSPLGVRLRLSAKGEKLELLKQQVETETEKLKLLIPDYLFGVEAETLAEVVGRFLLARNRSLSVAESCTGGFISHLVTSVAGSSAWYKGGITAYSNEVKQSLLGVSADDLKLYGAVSEQVVRQMALGVKQLLDTDYSIATSGIAGPGGGSEEKPVGTVWIGLAGPGFAVTEKIIFGDNRERNIIRSSQTALHMLRRIMAKEQPDALIKKG